MRRPIRSKDLPADGLASVRVVNGYNATFASLVLALVPLDILSPMRTDIGRRGKASVGPCRA